jgi:hypothetical protein
MFCITVIHLSGINQTYFYEILSGTVVSATDQLNPLKISQNPKKISFKPIGRYM